MTAWLHDRALLLVAVMLLGGCAARGPLLVERVPASPGGPVVELTETPFYPQRDYQCGPAALATVLVASGVQTGPDALVEQVYLPGRKGSLQAELVAATRRHDRLPYRLEGDLASLDAALHDGRPVLVLLNLGLDWLPVWHYAVVVGLDRSEDTVILRSGTERRRSMPARRFADAWRRAGNWALLVTRPDEVPDVARAGPWLEAAAGFEATGKLDAAEAAYRAALTRWPARPEAHLGLGNVQALAGHPDRAVPHYRAYLDAKPDTAAAWNNLASAQLATGDLDGARRSLHRAEASASSPAVSRAIALTREELAAAASKRPSSR